MQRPGAERQRPAAGRPRGTRRPVGRAGEADAEAYERASADLAMLAHPVRLRILEILVERRGQVCVCDLERALPVKQPTVSHHLGLLREAGWVEVARRGIWAYYTVRPAVMAAVRRRLQRLADRLAAGGHGSRQEGDGP